MASLSAAKMGEPSIARDDAGSTRVPRTSGAPWRNSSSLGQRAARKVEARAMATRRTLHIMIREVWTGLDTDVRPGFASQGGTAVHSVSRSVSPGITHYSALQGERDGESSCWNVAGRARPAGGPTTPRIATR